MYYMYQHNRLANQDLFQQEYRLHNHPVDRLINQGECHLLNRACNQVMHLQFSHLFNQLFSRLVSLQPYQVRSQLISLLHVHHCSLVFSLLAGQAVSHQNIQQRYQQFTQQSNLHVNLLRGHHVNRHVNHHVNLQCIRALILAVYLLRTHPVVILPVSQHVCFASTCLLEHVCSACMNLQYHFFLKSLVQFILLSFSSFFKKIIKIALNEMFSKVITESEVPLTL